MGNITMEDTANNYFKLRDAKQNDQAAKLLAPNCLLVTPKEKFEGVEKIASEWPKSDEKLGKITWSEPQTEGNQTFRTTSFKKMFMTIKLEQRVTVENGQIVEIRMTKL